MEELHNQDSKTQARNRLWVCVRPILDILFLFLKLLHKSLLTLCGVPKVRVYWTAAPFSSVCLDETNIIFVERRQNANGENCYRNISKRRTDTG